LLRTWDTSDIAGEKRRILDTLPEDTRGKAFPLYAGTDFEPLIKISPLLISLRNSGTLVSTLIEDCFQSIAGAGIFISSTATTMETRKHLQSLLEVIMPDFNTAAFRYYDPRVLHTFAHAANGNSLARLQGPLHTILWPYFHEIYKTWCWFSLNKKSDAQHISGIVNKKVLAISDKEFEAFMNIQLHEKAMKILAFGL
jgi:hypothetical protein